MKRKPRNLDSLIFANLLALSLTLSLGTAAAAQGAGRQLFDEPANAGSKIGINMADFTYYTKELVFVDLFKGASEWIPQRRTGGPWNTGENIALRTDGYPASLGPDQAAATLLGTGYGPDYPGGRYVCLFDGDGELELSWDAVVVATQPGRLEIDVSPAQGILLRIVRTNAADPVRNIRMVMPGHEQTYLHKPFHPRLLEAWKYFSTVRFMDWQKTNSTYQSAWADRVTPSFYSQQGEDGMALEHLIELCNQLDADPWFCMPHLCTDDYVTRFARMVKSGLEPERKVYVEYSNECWNLSFTQARYCQEMGVRLNLSSDPYLAQLRYYSQRSVEVFDLWRAEFGGSSRLVRVFGTQNVNTWSTQQILDWQQAHTKGDALGLNAYFAHELGDPTEQIRVQNLTPEQILMEAAQLVTGAINHCAAQEAEARQRGLEVVAFEAGQHLVGYGSAAGNTRLAAKFIAANRLPQMSALYQYFLGEWLRIGGDTCCLFNSTSAYSIYGSWGLLEDNRQPLWSAPKYMGTLLHIAHNRYR